MEARRTFDGARSYKQLGIILAALLAAACLAIAGVLVTSGMGASNVSKPPVVVHPAPGSTLNQDNGKGLQYVPSVTQTSKHKQTAF